MAAFFLGVSFTTVYHLIGWIGGYSAFWPLPIINTLAPLQGFWNAFIYARPRYLRIRERARRSNAPPLGFWLTLRMVFFPTTVPEEVVEQSTASAISSSVCLDLLDEAGPRRKNVEECLPGNIGVSDPDEGGREGIDAMNSRFINTAIKPGRQNDDHLPNATSDSVNDGEVTMEEDRELYDPSCGSHSSTTTSAKNKSQMQRLLPSAKVEPLRSLSSSSLDDLEDEKTVETSVILEVDVELE